MKIGIIGLGFVGLTFASVLAQKGFHVIGIDTDKEKIESISKGKAPFFEPKLKNILKSALTKKFYLTTKIEDAVEESDLVFVTVGTPMTKDGNIDLRIVLDVCKKIGQSLNKSENSPTIIIKSTVIPGTTSNQIKKTLEKFSQRRIGKDIGLITNPEFLREGKAIDDTLHPHLIVIGGSDKKEISKVNTFYKKFYNSEIPKMITNNTTAEIIKYANNSFLATKISFINNIANLCQILPGTNVDDVAKAIGIDPRIGKQFLNAGPGFVGSCLPKDLQAMIKFSKKMGEEPVLLKAVHKTNNIQINKILNILERNLGTIRNKKIGILGLSFKEESDDIRESVSIKLIKKIMEKNPIIKVHYPKAIENTKIIFGEKIQYCATIEKVLEDSNCVIIMTPWKQYSYLKNSDFQKMKDKIIIDTRRSLSCKKDNLKYTGLGIG